MTEKTFTIANFNSKKDLGLLLEDYTRPILADATEQVVDIPGIRGDLYQGMSIGGKAFVLDVILFCKSERQRVLKLRDLSNLFTQMMDGQEYPLKFDDEPDIVWWVHPTDISEPERISRTGHDVSFTITLKSSSGTGEGLTHEHEITNQTFKLTPKGNTTTYPIFTYIGQSEQTKVGISNGDEYVYIGKGFDVENQDAPIDLQPRILLDECNTLSTWTPLSSTSEVKFNIENGVLSDDASLMTSGNALSASMKDGDYYFGKNVAKKWHGPSRMQWLSKACKDYKITARFYINNRYARSRGKVELYLLDQNGRRIGKIMLKDNGNSMENMLTVQIGYDTNGTHEYVYASTRDNNVVTKQKKTTTKTLKYQEKVKKTTTNAKGKKTTKTETVSKKLSVKSTDTSNTFTDFYGNITLEKVGNKYTATIQKLKTNGQKTGKAYTGIFTDSDGIYENALAGIAIYFAKYDIDEDRLTPAVKYKPNTMKLAAVRVWEILGDEKQVVAEKDDEITIDCEENEVTKNGDSFMERTYIGSDFFEMTGGIESVFAVSPPPDENNKWYLSYKERVN